MSSSPTSPNLLKAAAGVSLLVLSLSVVSLFSLSNSNQYHFETVDRIQAYHEIEVSVLQGRGTYKTQVQEWKNLLLRGATQSDFEKYERQFQDNASKTSAAIQSAIQGIERLGLSTENAQALAEEYQALNENYNTALKQFREPDADASAIDQSIRGVDRPVNERFERLAEEVHTANQAESEKLQSASANRYQTLRRLTLAAATLAVLSTFVLVFRVNRGLSAASRTSIPGS